jgi:hypothetical protein
LGLVVRADERVEGMPF